MQAPLAAAYPAPSPYAVVLTLNTQIIAISFTTLTTEGDLLTLGGIVTTSSIRSNRSQPTNQSCVIWGGGGDIIYERSLHTWWPAPGVSPQFASSRLLSPPRAKKACHLWWVVTCWRDWSVLSMGLSPSSTQSGRPNTEDPRASHVHQAWLKSFWIFGKTKPQIYLCLTPFHLIKVQEDRLCRKACEVL